MSKGDRYNAAVESLDGLYKIELIRRPCCLTLPSSQPVALVR